MDSIPWGTVLGQYSLPGLCFLSVIFGLLIPRPSVERDQKQFQALLDRVEAERDEWKSVALRSLGLADDSGAPINTVSAATERVVAKDRQ